MTKTHGAVHWREVSAESSFDQRMKIQAGAKRRIARSVADLVADGAPLFLDVGSTLAYVALALQTRRDLMVVTNSLAVATALTGRNGNRIFMAGGELRAHDGGAFGEDATKFGGKAATTIAPLGIFQRLVTDAAPPARYSGATCAT